MVSTSTVLFVLAILWFAVGEYLRGRPTTPAQLSFVLKWSNPLGAIILCVLAQLCR